VSLETIVSGGQTGVDRAALDVALALGLEAGGFCPRGRRAEDGRIPARYPLRETAARAYAERTRRNVHAADATIVLTQQAPTSGTALTLRTARAAGVPFRHVCLPATEDAVTATRRWLVQEEVRTLNVAGPRASEEPGVYDAAQAFLERVLKESGC
jgi:predicted Rossmann fold nucleotide-binding protein DprA/Smf involved in DNA uptake